MVQSAGWAIEYLKGFEVFTTQTSSGGEIAWGVPTPLEGELEVEVDRERHVTRRSASRWHGAP